MKRLLGLLLLLAVCAWPARAQDSQAPPPQEQPPSAPAAPSDQAEPVKVKHIWPTPRGEISGGFAYRSYYGPTASSIGMIGAYGSYQYNFYPWVGLVGEVLGVNGSLKLSGLPPESLHVFTMLAGPQIYPLKRHKLDPFGHFLYGAGILHSSVPAFSGFGANSSTTVVKAWEVGGGMDLSLNHHWAVRLVQFDYVSAKFLGPSVPNQNGKRVSFGIVYRFGER
jgi:opacity protein-like surface antigen